MTPYKSLILIPSKYKYDTHLMTCLLSPLKNISKNLRSMSHYLMPYDLSSMKIILKIQEKHLMPHHLFPLKSNSENSCTMSHHLMTHHISLLKNNSKNSKKSPHGISPFSIEK
jgi:hypothetical protein